MSKDIAVQHKKSFSLTPSTLKEAMQLSEIMAQSDLVPKDYRNKPGNVLVAVQMGSELGLAPMQAIQNIAVINGRPSVWGDALLGLVAGNPICEYVKESFNESKMTATCKAKRAGKDEVVSVFSQDDATKAGLWNKPGPWQTYPKRMLQMRARAFCLRDTFPDLLKGISIAEEARDIPDTKDDSIEAVVLVSDDMAKEIEDGIKLLPEKSQAGFMDWINDEYSVSSIGELSAESAEYSLSLLKLKIDRLAEGNEGTGDQE